MSSLQPILMTDECTCSSFRAGGADFVWCCTPCLPPAAVLPAGFLCVEFPEPIPAQYRKFNSPRSTEEARPTVLACPPAEGVPSRSARAQKST
eukprot:1160087-Pelagomonas_calceolata.AAC.13